ncbi:sensor histidine kinase [Streptomyces colonosanans]|uniref:histidine kinase n=1 Tax=Streptomyces colonosanans TaxID=1428652 RepID=A0A1S2PBG6_9ACTN|nr:sensor histidine kinase [Streptomyces colonosanans]OIJ90937.1 two-component sensor histidine kinase [Streptomyces colonosanans]
MHATSPLPLLKRVPPGAWITLVWCTSMLLTLLARVRLPGEWQPDQLPAVQLYRWDGLLIHALSTVMVLVGAWLLERRPLAALTWLILAPICETATLGAGGLPMAQYLTPIVALYFIASARPRRTAGAALAMGIGTLVVYIATRLLCGWPAGISAEVAVALVTVIAWLLGTSTRHAREHAERMSAQTAAQAVTAERLRIAREMHDTVAHSIGIIALQAGAAARVATTQPEAAREAMRAVETTGRETLAGLRRMLVALRAADAGQGDDTAAAAQPAGLDDVDRLAAATTAAGVRVEVQRVGEPRQLPPDIDLSAFRIIQESVTNVVRHSGTHACRVTVDYGEEELALEVTDDGRGRSTSTDTGFGLAGMRERVALLHGQFSAAPRPEGGFRVAARLPVPAGAR